MSSSSRRHTLSFPPAPQIVLIYKDLVPLIVISLRCSIKKNKKTFLPMKTCPSPSVMTLPSSSLTSTTVSMKGVPRGAEDAMLQGLLCLISSDCLNPIHKTAIVVKHSRIAGPQHRLWYSIAAGPAGDLSNAIDVVDAGFIVLVSPAAQQSRRWAGFSAQSQHSQRGTRRQDVPF